MYPVSIYPCESVASAEFSMHKADTPHLKQSAPAPLQMPHRQRPTEAQPQIIHQIQYSANWKFQGTPAEPPNFPETAIPQKSSCTTLFRYIPHRSVADTIPPDPTPHPVSAARSTAVLSRSDQPPSR